MMTFEDYAAAYREQDVWLHQSVITAGENTESSLALSVEPDGFYSAVTEAGYELRTDPDSELTDNIMEPLSDESRVVHRVLREIVNASIEPIQGSTSDMTFFCGPVLDLNTCSGAEEGFAKVIRQMEDPRIPLTVKGVPTFIGYQILRNTDGQALGIRKGIGVPSTLTFEPSVINGIPYPPGSILRVESSGSPMLDNTSITPRLASGEPSELFVEEVTHAGFLRLSAFAIPPDERKIDFIPEIVDSCTRADDKLVIETYTIEEMQTIAQKALDSGLVGRGAS